MTTKNYELRISHYDPTFPKIGIWDVEKCRFLPDKWFYTIDSAQRALKDLTPSPKLVWKETGNSVKASEVQIFDHVSKLWRVDARKPFATLKDEALVYGKNVRVLEYIETQYVCEFEKD